MDYKEKYEMALERAKNLHKDAIDMGENIRAKQCEIIFPELKEESEDEKVRKEIVEYLKKNLRLEWATWLEKQDPKKHEEELEKAYKTADKVQYRRGYEAATKEMEKQGEQKPVWSEDDELSLYDTKEAIINYWHGQSQEDLLEWLKSLKLRYTWKPSDEQIGVIELVINNRPCKRKHLDSLYNDLKKLRENKL